MPICRSVAPTGRAAPMVITDRGKLIMNTISRRYAGALTCLVLLYGCATREAGITGASGASGAAPGSLYANGKLTAMGEARLAHAAKAYSEGNEAQAYAEFLVLAEQGHGESQYNLGVMDGDGVADGAPDIPKAIAWLQKADGAGYPGALFQLGVHYYKGVGVARDVPKAVAYWRKCAARGDNDCAFNAAAVLAAGKGMPVDRASAMTLFAQAGRGPEARVAAQSELARMYIADGKHSDHVKAIEWFEAAAANNDAQSQHQLARFYIEGVIVKADQRRALSMYQRAAAQGYAPSLNNLAILYRYGDGVARDQARAVKMFQQAHEAGMLEATVNLGDVTFMGWGTRADKTAGVRLYQIAADTGHPAGRCRYAQALRHGDGVARNVALAKRLKEAAGNAGYPCHSDEPLGKSLFNTRGKGRS
ncbi:sel1 repeat family protein [Massilia sp. CCM 8692]|uniref:Sel1 repeat family protein n=2 Tax=Massilia rubra TaxID=2607910 RepID=A0ABX0LPA1_9BURK|nr:sel1 repeat family protein [Massilia rubra]